MREKINQGLARALFHIRRMIIPEIGDAVLHEEGAGVITEAGIERGNLALGRCIGAHFKNAGRAIIVSDLGRKIGHRKEN